MPRPRSVSCAVASCCLPISRSTPSRARTGSRQLFPTLTRTLTLTTDPNPILTRTLILTRTRTRTWQQADEAKEELVLTYELISSAKDASSHTICTSPASPRGAMRLVDIEVPDIDWYI